MENVRDSADLLAESSGVESGGSPLFFSKTSDRLDIFLGVRWTMFSRGEPVDPVSGQNYLIFVSFLSRTSAC